MKFGIADVHVMLLRICGLHKNQPKEDCAFLMGLSEVNLRVCLEVTARLVKSLSCVKDMQLAFMFCSPRNHTVP